MEASETNGDKDVAGTGVHPPSPAAEEWNRRYGAEEHLFRVEPDEILVELASNLKPATALDLGAGEGRNALWLAHQGWNVTAVDASEVALGRLSAAAASEGLVVEIVVDDLYDYLQAACDKTQWFDLVVVAFVHPAPGDRSRLLTAAAAAVSSGGHLFVVAHHRDSFGHAGPPDPERLYAEEDLDRIDGGLEVLRLERRSGMSDVVHPGVDVFLWAKRPTAR